MIELLPISPNETEPVAKENAAISIRQLTPEEYMALSPRFESRGHQLPDPSTASAVGIFEDGKLVGYQVLKLMLHAQPTEIDEGYAQHFSALCKASEDLIRDKIGHAWVYVFCPHRLVRLCESRGMAEEPWIVMSKEILPKEAEAIPFESIAPLEGIQ